MLLQNKPTRLLLIVALCICLTVLLLSPAPITAQSSYETLISGDTPHYYYRLGEASGTTAVDVMTNGDGTYNGSPTLGVTGALSGDADTAITLDGTDDSVTAPSVELASTAYSIEVWLNLSQKGGGGYQFIFSAFSSWNDHVLIAVYDDGGILFRVMNGGANSDLFTSTGVFSFGQWNHLVVTVSGSNVATIYYNGSSTASNTLSAFVGTSPSIDLGTHQALAYTVGSADEWAIYLSELSSGQVLEHYQVGTGTTPTPTPTGTTTVSPTPTFTPTPSAKQYLIELSSGNFAAVDLTMSIGDIALIIPISIAVVVLLFSLLIKLRGER